MFSMIQRWPAFFCLAGSVTSLAVGACEKPAAISHSDAPSTPASAAPAPAAENAPRLFAKSRQADGKFTAIGYFDFKPGGQVDLTVTDTGAEGTRLKSAWANVSARSSLNTKLRDADGNLVGKTVTRDSPDYSTAVADVMSREFGFFLTPTKD
jgi:hypothetical protein